MRGETVPPQWNASFGVALKEAERECAQEFKASGRNVEEESKRKIVLRIRM
jgi:hypothetical protein